MLLAGLLASGAATGAAQTPTGYRLRLFFGELEGTGDSVYTGPAGGTFDVRVREYDSRGYGLGAFTFRIYFDAARITFVSARSSCPDSANAPLQPPVNGPNYVELSASGCTTTGTNNFVATVRFQVQAGATAGSSLYLEPRALSDRTAAVRSDDGDGDLDEVCLAVGIWGDVDDDALVNSRDALIALSNAVGLPTPGYFVARGDVDGDGILGSRDALAMLSASIGYAPAYGFRTGKGIATACAPQPTLPRPLYYIRSGTQPGLPGLSGLVVRAAGDSAETIVGDSAEASVSSFQRLSVSPGGAVVFVCYWQYYYDICRANADGSGLVNLTAGSFSANAAPAWSPAGDSIVFLRNNQVWVMAADGSGAHPIPSTPTVVYGVSWDPTPGSRRIAYTDLSVSPHRVRTRDLDSTVNDSVVYTAPSNVGSFRFVDWSPAGDSLVFDVTLNGYRNALVIPRAGGAAKRLALIGSESSQFAWPAWTDQGVLLTLYQNYPGEGSRLRLFLLRPDGRVVRLRRSDARDNYAAGMARP
jgi:hypothetical protein